MMFAYPAIFTQGREVVYVEIPDLGISTEGKDNDDAFLSALNAMVEKYMSMVERHEFIPSPTEIEDVNLSSGRFASYGKSFVSLIEADVYEDFNPEIPRDRNEGE